MGTLIGCVIGGTVTAAFLHWRNGDVLQWLFVAGLVWAALCFYVVEVLL